MEFSVELKKMADKCEFGDYLNNALRNQFVFGIRSGHVQQRLMEIGKLTFTKAVSTAVAMELSATGGEELHTKK
jgi:hypothetical protein